MKLRMTATLAICLAAGVAFGIALARPGGSGGSSGDAAPPVATGQSEEAASDDAAGAPADGGGFGHIEIRDFSFNDIVVPPGANVAVRNLDDAQHTVTAREGSFTTGPIDANGVSNIIAPTEPGTYEFYCEFHEAMTGTVTVVDSDDPPTTGTGDDATGHDGADHDGTGDDDTGEPPATDDAALVDPAADPPPRPATLAIDDFSFTGITVAAGAEVIVDNGDGTQHTVTARGGEFDTGVIGAGGTATFVAPAEPGVYELFCEIHPNMTGTLTVT